MSHFLQSYGVVPSAFIADNDIIAVSAIQAFQQAGFRVPEDISIIGFDDSDICTIFTPNLTTVKADFSSMAKLATSQLINMIKNTPSNFTRTTVGTALVKRQSVTLYSQP